MDPQYVVKCVLCCKEKQQNGSPFPTFCINMADGVPCLMYRPEYLFSGAKYLPAASYGDWDKLDKNAVDRMIETYNDLHRKGLL